VTNRAARDSVSVRCDLRSAIANYWNGVVDTHRQGVFDRLCPRDYDADLSHLVLPAFEAVPRARWSKLISACVHAEKEQRQHRGVVEQTKRVVEKVAEAKKALVVMERFVKVLCESKHTSAEWRGSPPWHPGQYFHDGHPEREALRTLQELILFARHRAEEELQLHSQKADVAAGRLAGIGIIKDAIRTYAPLAPNWRKLVAHLATAALDTEKTVSEGMVRHALTPRERVERSVF